MFSKQDLAQALRKALAAVLGGLLAFALLSALLIAGVVLVLRAAVTGLTPLVGEAAALGLTGLACFLLLGVFFWRLIRTPDSSGKDSEGTAEQSEEPLDLTRRLIRKNPWEAAITAFVVGILGQGDMRARALLLKGGLLALYEAEALKQADLGSGPEPGPGAVTPGSVPGGGEP